jgi:hypothetical protein
MNSGHLVINYLDEVARASAYGYRFTANEKSLAL